MAPAATAAAQKQAAPLGEWQSPITSELITSKSIRLGSPTASQDGYVYWIEGRPTEGGRQVLVRKAPGGAKQDVTPGPESGLNVRTRVHEYGGGECLVTKDAVYFSNFKDQRLYKQTLGSEPGEPRVLTPAGSGLRFADAVLDSERGRLVAVCEDHSGTGEAVNSVVAVDTESGVVTRLAGGHDFYSSPRLSPDGSRLAWICWNHPNMPWDDTELWAAEVASDGSLHGERKVSGGQDESVTQPQWSRDNRLYFVSDRGSGWWNLHRASLGPDGGSGIERLFPKRAEFAQPAWMFGGRSYNILPDGRLLASYSDPKQPGIQVAIGDPASGELEAVDTGYSLVGSISIAEVEGNLVLATLVGSAKQPSAVAALVVADMQGLAASKPGDWTTLQRSTDLELGAGDLSEPRVVEFPTTGGKTAFLNFYPPANAKFHLPESALPPLLVKIHGGPTSQASTGFNLSIQYWTSRGYAVADVNYGGSTGYGREYRNRLVRSWGVVDVDDCCNAAKHLASRGFVDAERLCITGGSAGGYTTLACLAFRDVFSAGASHYGVADLKLLAQETHKFESRYLDNLIGKLPEDEKVYAERSPINAIDKFDRPVAFFQGTEDEVVPPNQAEIMYEQIKAKGVPTALVMFEGEQHGFRGALAIRRALDGEFWFYGRVLGFPAAMPADLEGFDIANL